MKLIKLFDSNRKVIGGIDITSEKKITCTINNQFKEVGSQINLILNDVAKNGVRYRYGNEESEQTNVFTENLNFIGVEHPKFLVALCDLINLQLRKSPKRIFSVITNLTENN